MQTKARFPSFSCIYIRTHILQYVFGRTNIFDAFAKKRGIMDKKIISLLVAKDETGLTLFKNKYDKLLRYVISGILNGHESDIEECLNDTYLKLWDNASTYDFHKASLKNYSVVIARNLAINRLRQVSRYSFIEPYEESEAAINNLPGKSSDNPEEALITKENIQTIKTLISKIKGTDRKILELKFFYMQDSASIAKILGLTVSAVDNRMYKLRKKLRLQLMQEL